MRRDSCVGVTGDKDSSNLKINPVFVGMAVTDLTGKRATDHVCHLDDVKQHAGRQALEQAGAVVGQVWCQDLEDEEYELDHASQVG